MKRIKTIAIELTEEEYDKAVDFKNFQIGKVTWKDIIMDYIKLKKLVDEVETESKRDS